MPNYMQTILRANQPVLDALLDKQGDVDFNTMVPMPANIWPGDITLNEHGDWVPADAINPEQYVGTWHDWSRLNWGTKWNAIAWDKGTGEHTKTPGELRFQTAWNHPAPVIAALSRKFPDEAIRVAYADEDTGSNLGVYEILNGEIVKQADVEERTPAANNLARLIREGQTAFAYEKEMRGFGPEWYKYADPLDPSVYLDNHYDPFDLLPTT